MSTFHSWSNLDAPVCSFENLVTVQYVQVPLTQELGPLPSDNVKHMFQFKDAGQDIPSQESL